MKLIRGYNSLVDFKGANKIIKEMFPGKYRTIDYKFGCDVNSIDCLAGRIAKELGINRSRFKQYYSRVRNEYIKSEVWKNGNDGSN